MLPTESPRTATTARTSAPTAYGLRLHGGTEHEPLIPIPPAKHSIGSGPRCSLRLQYPGVQPLHCLILHEGDNLRVRRWAEDALLNGSPFDDASLAVGDVLSIGSVELEVVAPGLELNGSAVEVAGEPTAEPTSEIADESSADESELEELEVGHSELDQIEQVDRVIDAISTLDDPTVLDETLHVPDVVSGPAAISSDEVDDESPATKVAPAEVVETIAAIEPVESFEPFQTNEQAPCYEAAEQAAENTEVNAAALIGAERPIAIAVVRKRDRRLLAALRRHRNEYNELAQRVSALEGKLDRTSAESPSATAAPEDAASVDVAPAADTAANETEATSYAAELAEVQDQLAVRKSELAHARYSIDVLERQLIDSQHTMNALADERVLWEKQFSEFEARLTEYVGRIQELELLLDQACELQEQEAPTAAADTTEWVEEPIENESVPEEIVNEIVDSAIGSSGEEPLAMRTSSEVSSSAEIADEVVSAPASETLVVNEAVQPAEASVASPTNSSEDVDAALEHLRGLAIWRQDADEATSGAEAATESADIADSAAEVKPQNGSQPASFIDRYSHLFDADETHEPNEPKPQPPARALQSTETVVPAAVGNTDEESIEQYMAKLMERMRGSSTVSSEVEQPVAQAVEADPEPESTLDDPLAPSEPLMNLEDIRPKSVAPEFSGNLAAMRALANESSRQAIGIHTARTLRGNTKTRCVVSLLGAAAGIYLLLLAPSWKSMQFVAGCAAAIVALYWGRLALASLIKGIRLGAFEHWDEFSDPEKTLHPPLPIDVERPAREQVVAADLEPARGADVAKVAQMISQPDVVEDATETT